MATFRHSLPLPRPTLRGLVVASFLWMTLPASALEYDQVWRRIRTVGLDTEHAVKVERLDVKMGVGLLNIVVPFSSSPSMLKHLAERVDNGVIDTPTFIKAIERMSGLSLETFAAQFIYGTGVPEVYYRHEFVPQDDGSWVIQVEASQITISHSRYRLVRKSPGSWFVSREKTQEDAEARTTAFVVPFQIALASEKDADPGGQEWGAESTTEKGLGGNVLIRGETTEFDIRVDRQPREFWLDQGGEVLARFYCEQRRPKQMLRYRAHELARAAEYEEAEELYLRALSAPLVPEGERDEETTEQDDERDSRMLNCLIHLDLCRLYLETERPTEARKALEAAEELLRGRDKNRYRRSRIALESTFDVYSGDYASAYEQLSKWLRLDFPVHNDDSLADIMRRKKFRSGRRWWGDGQDYTLLAVAAFETGHPEVAVEAMEEAQERGADLQALGKLMAVQGGGTAD